MWAIRIEKCWGFSRCKSIGKALWYDDESPEGLWMCAKCADEWEMSCEAPEVIEDEQDDGDDDFSSCGACKGSGGEHPMMCRHCGGSGEAARSRDDDFDPSYYDRWED